MDREIRLAKKILESAGYTVTAPDVDHEDALDTIEGRVEEIISELRDTPHDNREELLAELESLSAELLAMEDDLSDELYNKKEDIADMIRRAEDTEYDGPNTPYDPYKDRGISPSDFH